jgi:hypothetical protein
MRVTHRIGGHTIAIGTDEEHPHPAGQPHAFFWVFDVADYKNIRPISTFHVVDSRSPYARAHLDEKGDYGHDLYGPGAHQFQEHLTGTLVFCTWFSAGLRILDIANPLVPKEAGWYLPEPGPGLAPQQRRETSTNAASCICSTATTASISWNSRAHEAPLATALARVCPPLHGRDRACVGEPCSRENIRTRRQCDRCHDRCLGATAVVLGHAAGIGGVVHSLSRCGFQEDFGLERIRHCACAT